MICIWAVQASDCYVCRKDWNQSSFIELCLIQQGDRTQTLLMDIDIYSGEWIYVLINGQWLIRSAEFHLCGLENHLSWSCGGFFQSQLKSVAPKIMTDTSDLSQSQSAAPPWTKNKIIIWLLVRFNTSFSISVGKVCDEVVMRKVLSRLIRPLADFSCHLFYLLC